MTSEASSPEVAGEPLRAGGIVLRYDGDRLLAAVVHRKHHDDWSFPKGKVDPGETAADAALREVWEETALHCRLGRYLGLVSHGLADGTARPTHYWQMRVLSSDEFVPDEEIDALRWFDLRHAAAMLTHARDRRLAHTVHSRAALGDV